MIIFKLTKVILQCTVIDDILLFNSRVYQSSGIKVYVDWFSKSAFYLPDENRTGLGKYFDLIIFIFYICGIVNDFEMRFGMELSYVFFN